LEILDKVKAILSSKTVAYSRTFNEESIDARIVLEDLAEFCRAHDSTYHADARIHAVLEGRREVWLRIQKYLKLTPDELWELKRKE